MVSTNTGRLVGADTSFAAANGLSTTTDVGIVSTAAAAAMSTGTAAQVSANFAMATGTAAQASASAAMSTGTAAQASADAAMATGMAAQASADAAVQTNNVTYTQTVALAAGALQAEADTPSSVFERSLIRTNATPLSLPGGDGFYISEIFPSVTWGPAWIYNGITNLLSLGGGGNNRALFIFYDTGGGAQVFDTENPPTAEQSGAVSITDATYTQTVALAGSALQAEADTLATVTARGNRTAADLIVGITSANRARIGIDGEIGNATNSLSLGPYAASGGYSASGGAYIQIFGNEAGGAAVKGTLLLSSGTGTNDGATIDFRAAGTTAGLLRYSGTWDFKGNTLSNIVFGAGVNGSTLTGITASQVGAIDTTSVTWRTNQVLGIDGTTNTLIYLGAP
jgi:hypothetical protein